MSESTPCNYCNHKNLERSAKAQRKVLVKRPDPKGSWVRGVRIHMLFHRDEPISNINFVAWFAEIPDHCCC